MFIFSMKILEIQREGGTCSIDYWEKCFGVCVRRGYVTLNFHVISLMLWCSRKYNKRWWSLIVTFEAVSCHALSVPNANLSVVSTPTPIVSISVYQTKINVSCSSGYTMDFNMTWTVIECMANAEWSLNPVCQRKLCNETRFNLLVSSEM